MIPVESDHFKPGPTATGVGGQDYSPMPPPTSFELSRPSARLISGVVFLSSMSIAIERPDIVGAAPLVVQASQAPSAVDRWLTWLDQKAVKSGFNAAQVRVAREIWDTVPSRFPAPPSAMADEDGYLCLSWRTAPWTLSIEIDQQGEATWLAYSTETREKLRSRDEIHNRLG